MNFGIWRAVKNTPDGSSKQRDQRLHLSVRFRGTSELGQPCGNTVTFRCGLQRLQPLNWDTAKECTTRAFLKLVPLSLPTCTGFEQSHGGSTILPSGIILSEVGFLKPSNSNPTQMQTYSPCVMPFAIRHVPQRNACQTTHLILSNIDSNSLKGQFYLGSNIVISSLENGRHVHVRFLFIRLLYCHTCFLSKVLEYL